MTIKTIHGCTCKPKFKIPGKYGGKFKNCAYGSGTKDCPFIQDKKDLAHKCNKDIPSFCVVQGKCGSNKTPAGDILNEYWDYCDWPQTKLEGGPIIKNKLFYIVGLIIYLVGFGVIIPVIFYKLKWFELLEVWIPNLDLLATALCFRFGPFNSGIFSFIYNLDADTPLEKWSQLIINYIALLGLTFVVARRTYKSRSIAHGWSVAFIMILMTYLMPNDYIEQAMEWSFWKYLQKQTEFSKSIREKFAVFCGLLVALFFIFAEKVLIKTQVPMIEKNIKRVFKYLKISYKI